MGRSKVADSFCRFIDNTLVRKVLLLGLDNVVMLFGRHHGLNKMLRSDVPLHCEVKSKRYVGLQKMEDIFGLSFI